MSATWAELSASRRLLWDGGLGSLLIDQGLPAGAAPEAWNVERGEVVARAHADYFAAGADVVLTNTFGANAHRLAETRCPYSTGEVVRAAVELARGVRPAGKLIAGDIGPTGKLLPPLGTATEAELEALVLEQASALEAAGVDLFVVETQTDLREAHAALRAVRRASSRLAVVSLTVRRTKRGFFTLMGDGAVDSLNGLLQAGAGAVGFNCTLSSDDMLALLREVRPQVRGPLLVQPNAGDPQLNAEGRVTYLEGPAVLAAFGVAAFELGADAVGGCCGTTPAHVRALRELSLARGLLAPRTAP